MLREEIASVSSDNDDLVCFMYHHPFFLPSQVLKSRFKIINNIICCSYLQLDEIEELEEKLDQQTVETANSVVFAADDHAVLPL